MNHTKKMIVSALSALVIITITGTWTTSSYSIQPISPALAAKYTFAMICKGLHDQYKDVLDVVDTHWKMPKNGQFSGRILEAHEEALHELLAAIHKGQFRSIDDFLAELELDRTCAEQWQKIAAKAPSEAQWIKNELQNLHTRLSFIKALVQEHLMFVKLAIVHETAQTHFNREISLLKSGQVATLSAYMRNNQRDYLKELTIWLERTKIAHEHIARIYPGLARQLTTLLKHLEGLRQVYIKL